MVKKLPYLFAASIFSLLTLASVESWPYFSNTLDIKKEKKNLSTQNTSCASMLKVPLLGSLCDRWDITVGTMYEMVSAQGSEIAVLTSNRNNSYFPENATGIEPQEQFDWGLKLAASYRFDAGTYKVCAEYSYLKQITNTDFETSYGQGFAPSIYANIAVQQGSGPQKLFNHLQAGSYTLLNNFRFYGFRPSAVTQNLEMTSVFGVEANFLQRRQKAVFSDDISQGALPVYPVNLGAFYQNYYKNTWWGVGPSVGIQTCWHLAQSINLIADAFASLNYGLATARTATHSKAYVSGQYFSKEAAVQTRIYQFAPVYRYLLGLNYAWLSPSKVTQFDFELAYEAAYFADVIKTQVPTSAYRTENGSGLGVQGVVMQVGFTF